MSKETGSQFVWTKYLLMICLIFLFGAFGYVTWWSFRQTREWFAFLDFENSNNYVSLALSIIFQYGQGPVLFLRSLFIFQRLNLEAILKRRTKGTAEYALVEHELKVATWSVHGLGLLFFVFASVDAWTNVQQMHAGLDAKVAQGIAVGKDKYFFTSIIGVVSVFVEEGLGVCFSLFSHTLNDIREVHNLKRIGWLDVFSDHARSLLSGGGQSQQGHRPDNKPHRPGGGGGSSGQGYRPPAPNHPVTVARVPIMPSSSANNPSFRPVTVSGARHPEPGVGFHRPAMNVPEEVDEEDEE